MTEPIDKEIEAIKVVLHALEPLTADVRSSVLGYVLRRLQIVPASSANTPNDGASTFTTTSTVGAPVSGSVEQTPIHIKTLKEQKKPRSASEMAALVAYYLENIVPKTERKDRIAAKDIETYFKIAEFPLTKVRFTLPNAKAAGYLDAVGSGDYKLNAVGHNLVVHSLPRDKDGKPVSRRRPAKKKRTAK